jgi:hypothetical protein
MKLNKYNQFLLESTIYDLLLESTLRYMSDFKSILNDLRQDKDPPIYKTAKILLTLCNKDMNLVQNFIGLDNDINKVSFVPDNKAIKDPNIVSVDFDANVIVADHSIIDELHIPREGLKHPRIESEVPSNRWKVIKKYNGADAGDDYEKYTLYHIQNIDDPSYYMVVFDSISDNRKGFTPYYNLPEVKGSVRVGRFINSILDIAFKEKRDIDGYNKSDFTASDIEQFVNAYTSKVQFRKNVFEYFEIVSGEDIRHWYLEDNYVNMSGQLGASCMRYKQCQDYLNIYVQNPEVCQLVIFKNEDKTKIFGRALLWIDVDGKKWIDRVYTSKDSYTNLFIEWSTKNKYNNVYNVNEKVQVEIKNIDYGYYPYMDSLTHFKYDDSKIDNTGQIITKVFVDPGHSNKPAYLYSDNNEPKRPYLKIRETNGRYQVYD